MVTVGGAASSTLLEPVAAPTPVKSSARVRTSVQWVLFAFPVGWFLAAGWVHRWLTEDGFIYLRVVQQIRAGHGPVFNPGERVEAFTGTLWVGLLSLADLVTPIRLEWLAVFLSLGLGAAGVALAMAGAKTLWPGRGDNALFVPLGALVFVLLMPVWVFASSGLETGLVFGWLGACVWILAGWARSPNDRLTTPRAVVLGLGWLTRPELVIFSAAFFVLVVVLARPGAGGRDRVRIAAAMLALPVAYQVFRMGYYGSLVPNTALAKEGSNTNWTRGLEYYRDFVDPYWLWVPALALLAGGYVPLALAARRHRRVMLVAGAFVVCGVLQATYIVAVGGDYAHARLLLPGFFALCAPVAAIPTTRRHVAALLVAPWAVAAMLVLRPVQYTSGNYLAHGFAMPQQSSFGMVTVDDYGWGEGGPWRNWYHGPGYYYEGGLLKFVRAEIPLRSDVHVPVGAFFGVGVASYGSGTDFHVLDLMGLADSFTAHLESTTVPGVLRYPGHEKPLPAPWIAARLTRPGSQPDPRAFPNFFNSWLIPPTTGRAFQEQVAWARAALKCDGIARILVSADAPMTPKRFGANFLRSFSQTRTRIPPDPKDAYRQFCGPGVPAEVRALRSGPAPTG